MLNLEPHRAQFSVRYPAYTDAPYWEIADMVSNLATNGQLRELLFSPASALVSTLLLPLIKIKNYKSQIPFPSDPVAALRLIVELKELPPDPAFGPPTRALFESLLNIEGFQLPTVSAVFHFCHPASFPIVDRNIEKACQYLQAESPVVFSDCALPRLPAPNTSAANKLRKYRDFIDFLNKLRAQQNLRYATEWSFREIDKALMVLGADQRHS